MSSAQPLPFAGAREFSSLDEYLAYREGLGRSDRPYYRKVKGDQYELVSSGQAPQRFTRAQLLEMFGFAC